MLNFKQNNLIREIPIWLTDKADASLMLWAGDCVHAGLTDVERLPDYDVYLCNGFKGLPENLNVNRGPDKPICICVLDIHDEQQLANFIELFKGTFKTINSDYYGNTPRLPMQAYCDLLQVGGSAFNTEGINAVFFPSIAFRDTLELFAPVLPEDLKPRRRWTKALLNLARDNELTVEATWTSPDLRNSYYNGVRNEQEMFNDTQARRYPNQHLYNLAYTAENIEEYWDTLPEHIFLTNTTRAFIMEDYDATWISAFKPRLIKYLERKVEMSMNEDDMQHFLMFYGTRSLSNETQIFALQIALKAIALSREAVANLIPVIRYYKDARREEPDETVFGVIFSKV